MRLSQIRRGRALFDRERISGRLLRGLGSSFAANLLAAVIACASSLVLARALGSEHFGVFTYVNSWLNIAVLAATLGLDAALVRFLPQYSAQRDSPAIFGLLRWSRRIVLATSMAFAVGLAAGAGGWYARSGSQIGLTLCVAAGSLPLLALVALNQGALQGLQQIGFSQTPRAIIRPLLLTAGVAACAWLQNDEVTAPVTMLVNVLALGGALLLGVRWLRQALPASEHAAPTTSNAWNWLRVALPMLLVSSMTILLHETSVVLTALFCGTTIAGVYAVATRVSRMLAFGMTTCNSIANPLIAELFETQDWRRMQLVTSCAATISLAVAVVLLLCVIVGGPLLLSAFGHDFEAGQQVVLILAFGQLLNAATGPVAGLLNMTGHHDRFARITVTISTLNLLGNVPAVMFWGIPGAAAVTSMLIAAQNIWAWYAVRELIGIDSTPLGFLKVRGMAPPVRGRVESTCVADQRIAA